MQLPDPSTLLALGVSLAMLGIILRGFASSARRELALRKQHRIDERRSDESRMAGELARPPGWFERHLGLLANLVLVAGLVITVVGFARS